MGEGHLQPPKPERSENSGARKSHRPLWSQPPEPQRGVDVLMVTPSDQLGNFSGREEEGWRAPGRGRGAWDPGSTGRTDGRRADRRCSQPVGMGQDKRTGRPLLGTICVLRELSGTLSWSHRPFATL